MSSSKQAQLNTTIEMVWEELLQALRMQEGPFGRGVIQQKTIKGSPHGSINSNFIDNIHSSPS